MIAKKVPSSVSVSSELRFDCWSPIHADDIDYAMVIAVLNSWSIVTAVPNYREVGGELLLRKVFQIAPASCKMFGLPLGTLHDDPTLSTNKKFRQQGANSVSALNEAIESLGPDLEPLEHILRDLGRRHARYKCEPAHWIVVGEALFHVLEAVLGPEKFTTRLRRCWVTLYNFISFHMVQGLLEKRVERVSL